MKNSPFLLVFNTFSEEEYFSVEKEFKEKIYIL